MSLPDGIPGCLGDACLALGVRAAAVPGHPRQPAAPDPPPDLALIAERTVTAVAHRRSTWTTWNIRAEAERQLRTSVPALDPARHRDLADAITTLAISPRYSISVEAPALLDEPPELRRTDGESVFTEHAAGRYTSQAVLDAEQRLLNATRTPAGHGIPGLSVAAALDGFEASCHATLDAGQRVLVTAFACDQRLLLAGIGPAGSGKTTAMRAYAHVLRQHGRRLIPLATSAAAADVLGRELSIQGDNLHKFLYEWTTGRFASRLRTGAPVPGLARAFALRPGDVVLVDEAGMAGTFLLDQLVQVTASRGATVRLLGDDRQLPAVESGGALRLVAAQPGTPQLTVLHRFRDPAEAAVTLQVRAGGVAAVGWYAANGRVRSGSREAMTQAAYNGWKADMLAGKVTLMAAATTADVTRLSARARADRVAAGQVEASGVLLHDGNLAGQDDWIVTRHNDRRMSLLGGRDWVKNADAWHVLCRHADGSLTVRHLGHGGRVRLPAGYVGEHPELLYATTHPPRPGRHRGHRAPADHRGHDPGEPVRPGIAGQETHHLRRRHPRPALRRGRPGQPGPPRRGCLCCPRDPGEYHRHRERAAARHRDDRRRAGGSRIAGHPGAPLPARRSRRRPAAVRPRGNLSPRRVGRGRPAGRPGLAPGRPTTARGLSQRMGPGPVARHGRGRARARQRRQRRRSPGLADRRVPCRQPCPASARPSLRDRRGRAGTAGRYRADDWDQG
ncbi:MAG TPA: AAA family ATPase [Trebonia sp.]|nr:AAA family ATPase [Trebonia sp.]